MTWTTFHRRADVLSAVIEAADHRLDGRVPADLPGVAETFDDEVDLIATLHLRWHTRLSGRIERRLAEQPMDLEAEVVRAWCETAADMPGVRRILDRAARHPATTPVGRTMAVVQAREAAMLAVMSGTAAVGDERAARRGARILERARRESLARPVPAANPQVGRRSTGLLERLKAAVAA